MAAIFPSIPLDDGKTASFGPASEIAGLNLGGGSGFGANGELQLLMLIFAPTLPLGPSESPNIDPFHLGLGRCAILYPLRTHQKGSAIGLTVWRLGTVPTEGLHDPTVGPKLYILKIHTGPIVQSQTLISQGLQRGDGRIGDGVDGRPSLQVSRNRCDEQ